MTALTLQPRETSRCRAWTPRAERYWQLIGNINGWPQRPSLTPVYRWFTEALRARR